ncbi:GTPase subunit of Type II restriction endonuclease [Calothrix parasitica NIES-267]|uniref:GTPase subunit of Type II restriction endonuclease n=1 Tax=Calothrix parasitica NIES-267 TaxID=1973488 RepID=A0A1Z4LYL8_9CYAN|nr:GTPase subunit of Type II restriction endonuclease [Calothrix parasitica NIES-267]
MSSIRPIQKILFGSPGTGKSYKVNEIAENELGISADKLHSNVVKTVFHPEYKYSDFMGKLLPLTSGNLISYKYYPGHFLQILGKAYRSIFDKREQNYLLVIDELNRGNATAIFGSVFQLLDRNNDGCSTYGINISDMEMVGLLNSMDYTAGINYRGNISVDDTSFERFLKDLPNKRKPNSYSIIKDSLSQRKIYIPPNLSIVCTINTSDESIYYLDAAFKRRWDWEYIEAPSIDDIAVRQVPEEVMQIELSIPEGQIIRWYLVIIGVNEFIKSCHHSIKKIEDKQIGWWFIIPEKIWDDNPERFPYRCVITFQQVRDKLMFYLWDSVFRRDKKPLIKLIEDKLNKNNVKLITYADFLKYTEELLKYWHDSVPDIKIQEQTTHKSRIKRTFS